MRSVTQVNVDETEEFFARPETPDVFRDSLCEQRENHFLGVGRVRRDETVPEFPEWVT
jgi:hypothetical protein